MRILSYDCFSGISGDMNLGAMIDLGVDKEYLLNELKKLEISGWELISEKDQRHGITGTKVTVRLTQHQHTHRHFSDIERIITDSGLNVNVKNLSIKIFRKLAEAEAKVHGVPVDHVHFHEVGAIDSIVDITGAAICFDVLKPGIIHFTNIELGGGFADCDHGRLPVPAPATAEILREIPVRTGGVNFEATTPTGAAIISSMGNNFSASLDMKITKTGYGIGQKDNKAMPNLLRVFLAEGEESSARGYDALQLECNIDDMNPELFDFISERLFKAGASDVFLTSIFMKKNRPGIILNVICEPGIAADLKKIIFIESTSLGIRTFPFRKDTLSRKTEIIETEYGNISIKRSFFDGIEVSSKPEYEDCKRIANEKAIPIKEVYNRIMALLAKH